MKNGHEHIPAFSGRFSLLSGQKGVEWEKKVRSGHFTFMGSPGHPGVSTYTHHCWMIDGRKRFYQDHLESPGVTSSLLAWGWSTRYAISRVARLLLPWFGFCVLSWHLIWADIRTSGTIEWHCPPPHTPNLQGRVNLHLAPVLICTQGSVSLVWQTTEISGHKGGSH